MRLNIHSLHNKINKPEMNTPLPPPQPLKFKKKIPPPKPKQSFYHPYKSNKESRVYFLRDAVIDDLNHILRYCDPAVDLELSDACEVRWENMGTKVEELKTIVEERSKNKPARN